MTDFFAFLIPALLAVALIIIDGVLLVYVLDWLDFDEDFRQAIRSRLQRFFGGRDDDV